MTDLHAAVQQYLDVRRALGFKLRQHEGLLRDFVQFMDNRGQTMITIDLAVAWATAPIRARIRLSWMPARRWKNVWRKL